MKVYKSSEAARAKSKAWREANPERARAYHRTDEARLKKNARRLAWSRAHPERQRAVNEAVHLKRYHGLTVAEYREMVAQQKGLCAICRKPPTGKKHCGKLHVDHDHLTQTLRDLLCADCNRGLGLFHDNPKLLLAAAWYVDRHRAKLDKLLCGNW